MRYFISELIIFLNNFIANKVPFHFVRRNWYRKIMKFDVADSSAVLMGVTFDARKGFVIGENSVVNEFARMDTRGGIVLGRNVSVSSRATILTASHDPNSEHFAGYEQGVAVGDFAWIGLNAVIMPGVTIGEGAVVAAGAVVTRSVKPFDIVAGVPAKPVGRRNTDLRYSTRYQRLFK
ncbi:acyltransferase [Paraburkholderia lacunae]|nr:acyltransferase [Paraburkholderia lacunae]